ncbi:histidine kinase [Pseudomonas aeruginosa]|uniref:histidine kinase n=1 Tax=Pseudomonas aeruginosa TaxID=287 RepID=UPI000FF05702|nr:histidine kinase [Pseudomonas aeruginosa]RQI94349.1 histidine kinase [Pseudomonas aeruginosa]
MVFGSIAPQTPTSKKTGNAYDIAVVHFAVDATQSTRPDRKFALGLEPQNLPIAPEAVSQFQRVEPLSSVNFEFEPDPRNMQRNRIRGVKPVPKAGAQAAS